MTWEKGRDTVEQLLLRKHVEQVPADPDEARYLIERARRHLATAEREADADPEIAYDALYAAARKALTAVLRQQGLRPTREGGHEAVIQAAEAQLTPPLGAVLRPYRRLRRQRAQGDYLASEGTISPEDVRADLPAAIAIVGAAADVVPHLPVFVPRRS
jgi:HEPN domain-containing protein